MATGVYITEINEVKRIDDVFFRALFTDGIENGISDMLDFDIFEQGACFISRLCYRCFFTLTSLVQYGKIGIWGRDIVVIRAAICDDEPTMLNYLYEHITAEFKRQRLEAQINKFTTGKEFLNAHKGEPFDVAFLDIRMPDINGFDVAAEIRGSSEKTYIIFITTENALVYDSFNFQPFDFIPKTMPSEKSESENKKTFLEQHISSVIKRLIPKFALNQQICLELPHGEKTFVLPSDIRLIRSVGNYVEYVIIGHEVVKQRKKLDDVESELTKLFFLRVHKSYIINMKFIKNISFSKSTIIMDDNTMITISKSQRKQAEAAYVKFLRNYGGEYNG